MLESTAFSVRGQGILLEGTAYLSSKAGSVVGGRGLEPLASAMSTRRSNQLS